MTSAEIAEQCHRKFDELTKGVDDEDRWDAAEELSSILEVSDIITDLKQPI